MWSYGLATTRWSPLHALLWTSNDIIVAAVALGGLAAVQTAPGTSQPPQ